MAVHRKLAEGEEITLDQYLEEARKNVDEFKSYWTDRPITEKHSQIRCLLETGMSSLSLS